MKYVFMVVFGALFTLFIKFYLTSNSMVHLLTSDNEDVAYNFTYDTSDLNISELTSFCKGDISLVNKRYKGGITFQCLGENKIISGNFSIYDYDYNYYGGEDLRYETEFHYYKNDNLIEVTLYSDEMDKYHSTREDMLENTIKIIKNNVRKIDKHFNAELESKRILLELQNDKA